MSRKNTDKDIEIIDLNGKITKDAWDLADDKSFNDKRKPKSAKNKNNKEFAIVTYVFLALFISLAGYFCYFVAFKSEDFINSPYNARLAKLSETIIRGDILTSDGTVVATTKVASDKTTEHRSYPYANEYAHAIGYAVNGMSGVELDANFNLLRSHSFILKRLVNEITDQKNQGDSVVTTLDSRIQSVCYDQMGSYNGAVIAIEPSSGKIIAMVSKPDFDPNTIAEDWKEYTSEDSSSTALLNRTTQGLYPPGSTFKIVTALEYLLEGGHETDSFTCNGSSSIDNYTIHCYHNEVHGTQTFLEAFGNSCNVAFGQIGLNIDRDHFQKLTNQLLFNQTLPTQLSNVKNSEFKLSNTDSDSIAMQTAIGQGSTVVTPIHMAMIASAIANHGVLMEPYIIDHTQNDNGNLVKQMKPIEYHSILSAKEAQSIQKYLRYVVTNGTASQLNVSNYEAYGKTGTAEYSSNKDESHSWFVGYAQQNGKQIAIAVVMEGAGAGSAHAVPLAKSVFDTYFSMTQ